VLFDGVLHDDFLRLLWVIAGQFTADEDETKATVDPSEVRDRATYDDPRHHIFYKMRARVALGAARATSMRLVGIPGAVHYVAPPRRFYDPSDPTFRNVTALNGLPLGAFPLGGEAVFIPGRISYR